MRHYQRPRAFTLIELLVVVAIIALLVAILLPALSRARESAQTTVCATNLYQIGLAMELYAQQYHEYYPAACSSDQQTTWDYLLLPYLPGDLSVTSSRGAGDVKIILSGSTNYVRCPSDTAVRHNDSAARSYSRVLHQNEPYTVQGVGYFPNIPIRQQEVVYQSSCFLVGERHKSSNILTNNWESWIAWGIYFLTPTAMNDINYMVADYVIDTGEFHGNGQNFLFFDTHVDKLAWADAVGFEFSSVQNHWVTR